MPRSVTDLCGGDVPAEKTGHGRLLLIVLHNEVYTPDDSLHCTARHASVSPKFVLLWELSYCAVARCTL